MSTVFVFPGQGSQAVGMGKALAGEVAAARAVFDEVDEALGEKLSALIFEGPEEELTRTRNAQPALMAVSMAALRALEAEGISVDGHAAYVAGHSLGEYSALAAAGSLSIGDAARLLRLRGDAMQKAVPVGVGAMAALLGLDLEPRARPSRAKRRRPTRSARWRTTTRPGRSSCPGTRPRSSGRRRSPRAGAPGAPCCSASRRRSIAR